MPPIKSAGSPTVPPAVTQYATTTNKSGPSGIAAGPDGALWFTETLANNIGRAALGFNPAAANQAQQAAPIMLGTSGSNKVRNAALCCTGTLGSLVTDAKGTTYILSNNHVLANSNPYGAAAAGDAIIQRGFGDTSVPPFTLPACALGAGTINVANLTAWVNLVFGGNNDVDAAIAQTVAGAVNTNGNILGIGGISTATVAPKLNMMVEKSGRTTGLTSGSIDTLNLTISVSYIPCTNPPPAPKVATFLKQFRVLPLNTFSRSGDSGSLVLEVPKAGKSPNPVGLLFAGDRTGRTIANTASEVLKLLSNQIATGPLTFVGTKPTAAELATLAAVTPDPQVEAVSAIKDRYDAFLLSLPEVVGHGVSYSQTGSGRPVIRLFLRRATDAARRAAPVSLEGVPVEIEETGEYTALLGCPSAPPAGRQAN